MTAVDGWTLTLPLTKPLSLNDRQHYMAKARQTRYVRDSAHLLAQALKIPALKRAQVWLEYQPKDRRRRDQENLIPTAKATLDGLVDAGVFEDDTPEFVDHLMPKLLPVGPVAVLRFRIVELPVHVRSLDGDGEPLSYCAVCFQDWPCVGDTPVALSEPGVTVRVERAS